MNEMLIVRGSVTRKTPKWAQTTDGILRRWKERRPRTLTTLRLGDRLQRLFVAACCRSSMSTEVFETDSLDDRLIQACLEGIEQLAEGDRLMTTQRADARIGSCYMEIVESRHFTDDTRYRPAFGYVMRMFRHAAKDYAPQRLCDLAARKQKPVISEAAERARQGRLLAGIVGSDWHLAPEWCTETAVQLARVMYESRDFGAMPILADALQDAGCDNEGWLARMRDTSWPWCRGWPDRAWW
jgi:hypothetical protein